MSFNALQKPTENIKKEINTQELDLFLNVDNKSIVNETKISPIKEDIVKPNKTLKKSIHKKKISTNKNNNLKKIDITSHKSWVNHLILHNGTETLEKKETLDDEHIIKKRRLNED